MSWRRLAPLVAAGALLTGCGSNAFTTAQVKRAFKHEGLRLTPHDLSHARLPLGFRIRQFVGLAPVIVSFANGAEDYYVIVLRSSADTALLLDESRGVNRGVSPDDRQFLLHRANVVVGYFANVRPQRLQRIRLALARLR